MAISNHTSSLFLHTDSVQMTNDEDNTDYQIHLAEDQLYRCNLTTWMAYARARSPLLVTGACLGTSLVQCRALPVRGMLALVQWSTFTVDFPSRYSATSIVSDANHVGGCCLELADETCNERVLLLVNPEYHVVNHHGHMKCQLKIQAVHIVSFKCALQLANHL